MSKQSEAKAAQGYVDKPSPRICMNCANYLSEVLLPEWAIKLNKEAGRAKYSIDGYGREKNIRCGIGDFAVKKTATCSKFEAKKP